MDLEDLKVYNRSMDLAEEVWTIVSKWSSFEKNTFGRQLVRSADSVSANLSEGYGRFHFNESRHFAYYSRGSLYETKTWLVKSKNRSMLDEKKFDYLMSEIDILAKMLNAYINSIGQKK